MMRIMQLVLAVFSCISILSKELELERPLFMLRRAEEKYSADCFDTYRKPPPDTFQTKTIAGRRK